MVTWKIWLDPNIKTVNDRGKQPTNPPTYQPTYFRYADFVEALRLANVALAKHCGWVLQPTTASDYVYRIYSQNPTTYRGMYLGNYGHAAGMNFMNPRVIYIHDGYVPAGMHQHGNFNLFHSFVGSSLHTLAGLILHELGHDSTLLGRPHTHDFTNIMGTPSAYIVNLLQSRFGPPIGPPPPPPPKPTLTEVAWAFAWAVGSQEVHKLTYTLSQKGEIWYYLNGEEIIHHDLIGDGTHTTHFTLGPGDNTLKIVFKNSAGDAELIKNHRVKPQAPDLIHMSVKSTGTHGHWTYYLSQPATLKFRVDGTWQPSKELKPGTYTEIIPTPNRVTNIKMVATNESGMDEIELDLFAATNDFPPDVNDDGVVTPQDVLTVINAINKNITVDLTKRPKHYYDVNRDGVITAADALAVINHLNRR